MEGLGPELTSFWENEEEFWVDTSHRADMNCQGLRYPRAVAALKDSWVIHRKLCPRGLFGVLSVKGNMVQIWCLEENVRKRPGSLWCLVHTWSMVRRVRPPYVVYGGPCVFPVTLLIPVLPLDTEWLP